MGKSAKRDTRTELSVSVKLDPSTWRAGSDRVAMADMLRKIADVLQHGEFRDEGQNFARNDGTADAVASIVRWEAR